MTVKGRQTHTIPTDYQLHGQLQEDKHKRMFLKLTREEGETDRQTDRQRQRHRDRDRQRETQRERQRDRKGGGGGEEGMGVPQNLLEPC